MAGTAPRLPFLWPMLWRPSCELSAPVVRSARAARRVRAYHPSIRPRQQEPTTQRYGTANEPPAHLGGGKGLGPTKQQPERKGKQPASRPKQQQEKPAKAKALPKIGEALQQSGEKEAKAVQQEEVKSEEDKPKKQQQPPLRGELVTSESKLVGRTSDQPLLDAGKETPVEPPPEAPKTPEDSPMESVLDAVPEPAAQQKKPSSAQEQQQQQERKSENEEKKPDEGTDSSTMALQITAPHMDTPRHVHHFDTYGLVKHLAEGGWDERQAITIMKSVRLMLADNTDLANEALVSKSNLENEAYLFKAACAELKTEVVSRRRAEQEKMRTERGQLQHEVDILSQRLGQESSNMKDELKGLFDDRKMAVRNEQREMESKLQQLNQRITVSLQADARSDIEGLRWVMTRRVIITLGIVVLMVLGSLKLYSNAAREAEESSKRRANQKSGGTQTDEFVGESRSVGIGGVGEVVVKEGDNPAFVSLG